MKNYKQQIIDYILSNENLASNKQLIGVEIEHIVMDNNGNSVLYSYKDAKPGVKEILEELKPYYDNAHYSKYKNTRYIYELTRKDTEISIEPGAQLEVSFKPCINIAEIKNYYQNFLIEISPILNKYNYHLEYTGYRPDLCALEVPIVPRNRYICMDAQFKNISTHGACMMRNSASVQVSIDFNSEADCIKKLKVGTIIAPLIYFLYDNSPIFEKTTDSNNEIRKTPSGLPVPKRMARYEIWKNTDNDRCISIPDIFDENFSVEKYVDKILKTPLIFAPQNMKNLYNDSLSIKFNEDNFYPASSIDEIIKENVVLDKTEILQILSFLFYDARLKNLIELRAADCMPPEYIYSYLAFIKGIFYNKDALDTLSNKFKDIKFIEYIEAGKSLYKKGWDALVYGQNLQNLLRELFELAKQGLDGKEKKLLEITEKLIEEKLVLKDKLAVHYKKNNNKFYPLSKTHDNTMFQANYFIENKGCLKNKIDRSKKHLQSKAIFENRVVDTGYFAKVYDQTSLLQFKALTKTCLKILHKVMDEYYTNKQYKELWQWDSFSQKLIDFKPKYKQHIPICRIDIFSDEASGKFNICEFNTGGTAAQSEVTYLSSDAKASEPFLALKKHNNKIIHSWELYKPWVRQFIAIYNEWATNVGKEKAKSDDDKFTIAMIDFMENSQIVDFYLFQKAFKELGYNCIICDIRDLTHKDKRLMTQDGKAIDAVYKRVTLNDFLPHESHPGTQAFVNAVLNDEVCPIDWFSTQIVHDKQISYILHNPMTQNLLTESEKEFVNLHIPLTYRLTNTNCKEQSFIDNKDSFIIKPLNGRRSKDIFSGKEYELEEWKNILIKCSKIDNFIIQRFCEQYTTPNILINQDKLEEFTNKNFNKQIKAFSNMDGLYCYNGELSGIWLRQGDHSQNSIAYNVTCATFYEEG